MSDRKPPLGRLLMLAFDHREDFERRLGGDSRRIRDAKRMIFAGAQALAAERPDELAAGCLGIFVDERYGAEIAREARADGFVLAMPVEKSPSAVFDFEYGDDFAEHIAAFDPDLCKVLLRYSPADAGSRKELQITRLLRLQESLRRSGHRLLLELLVPMSPAAVTSAEAREQRTALARIAMRELQGQGLDPDVWKLEPPPHANAARLLTAQARAVRDDVPCVVLGGGEDVDQIRETVRCVAAVEGFVGFTIGRTIWGGAVEALRDGAAFDECVREVSRLYGLFVDAFVAGATEEVPA